jgi:hypothetical protein
MGPRWWISRPFSKRPRREIDAGRVDHRPLKTRCIFVMHVIASLIVESRNYLDHLASAGAYGTLPDVLARWSAWV